MRWLALLAVLAPSLAVAQEVVITEYGEFTYDSERPDPDQKPNHVTGSNFIDNPQFVTRTTTIPGQFCEHFGIKFKLAGPPGSPIGEQVTIRLTHPLINNPDGRSGTVEDTPSLLTEDETFTGFGFDYRYEIVTGEWSFAIMSGDRVLAEKKFQVVRPPDGNIGSRNCGAVTS